MSIERVVSATMDDFWGHYEAGHFDDGLRLARQIGLRAEALDFALNPDSYYIPNRQGDRFVRPHGVSRDLIPVIGLADNDRHSFESPHLHPLQRSRLNPNLAQAASKYFATLDGSIGSPARRTPGTAGVHVSSYELSDGESYVASSPRLKLHMHHNQPPESTCVGVVLHEAIHVAQHLGHPVGRYDDILRRELEAYGVQGTLVHSVDVPYTQMMQSAGTVDNFRRKHLGEAVFNPTPAFEQAYRTDPDLRGTLPS